MNPPEIADAAPTIMPMPTTAVADVEDAAKAKITRPTRFDPTIEPNTIQNFFC